MSEKSCQFDENKVVVSTFSFSVSKNGVKIEILWYKFSLFFFKKKIYAAK